MHESYVSARKCITTNLFSEKQNQVKGRYDPIYIKLYTKDICRLLTKLFISWRWGLLLIF